MESSSRNPYCPTGNCTWAPFISAGWCSSCEDVTSQIKVAPCKVDWNPNNYELNETKHLNCTASIASGLPIDLNVSVTYSNDEEHKGYQLLSMNFDYAGFYLSYSPAMKPWSTSSGGKIFNGIWNPLLVFNFWTNFNYAGDEDPTQNLMAQQCMLTPCLRNYSLQVRGGQSELTTLSTQMQSFYFNESADLAFFIKNPESWPPSPPQDLEDYTLVNPTLFIGEGWRGGAWEVNNFTTLFNWPDQEGSYVYNWPRTINDALVGSSPYYISHNMSSSWKPGDSFTSGLGQGANSTNFGYTLISEAGTPEKILESIADALTSLNLNLYYLNDTHNGHVFSPQVHVHVRWAWIAMPAIMMGTGIAFTILILRTQSPRKIKLWKTSSFVFLHHGLSGGGGGDPDFNEIQSASTMDELAKRTSAHFETDPTQSEPLLKAQNDDQGTPKLPLMQNMHQGFAVQWPV